MKRVILKCLVEMLLHADYQTKMTLKSGITVIFNGILGIGKLFVGLYYRSDWFVVNAFYYLALAVAKLQVLRQYKHGIKIKERRARHYSEIKVLRYSGRFECLVGISYFCMSLHTLLVKETAHYPEYITYLVVIIAFLKIGFAVHGINISRKDRTPIIFSLKIFDFTDAIVSIVVVRSVLQTMNQADFSIESSGIFGIICSLLFVGIGYAMLFYRREGDAEGQ